MKTLPHKFTSSSIVHNVPLVIGYTRCMADIFSYINSVDEPNLNDVKNIICRTNDEIINLEKEFIKTELTSLTKITNPQ